MNKNMPKTIRLYYGHDPMCSFCWGFRPEWKKLQTLLRERYPDLELVYIMGGLAPDSDEPMPADMQDKLQATWKYIEERIPGTRFNFDFWRLQQARRSTYPACRAVMAAKMLNAELEATMILAIQKAYYLQALNPSNEDTLVGCAESIGLDPSRFTEVLRSEACEQAFAGDRELSHNLGISSFPSLVLTHDHDRFNIPVNYNNAKAMLKQIEEVLPLLRGKLSTT